MIPKEVKDFIQKLIKEAISEELNKINTKIEKIDNKITELEKDMLIQKEGENI